MKHHPGNTKIKLFIIILIGLILPITVFAQEKNVDKNFEDLFEMPIEELMNLQVKVDVASLFIEDEFVVGSMVSSITSDQWKKLGARRVSDVLANQLSVVVYPHLYGSNAIAVRGYATDSSSRGTAYVLDGVPVNDFFGGGITYMPDFGLGTLKKIELIKGPGSAIYGSDAFHGVVSMKTFESGTDHCSLEFAGAYPLYGDANIKLSQGFFDNSLRVNMAASAHGHQAQEMEYEYDYPGNAFFAGDDPIKGTGTRKAKYKSHTAVLKLNIIPLDKVELKLGSYISYGKFNNYPGISNYGNLGEMDISGQESLFFMGNGDVTYTFSNKISAEVSGYVHKSDQVAELRDDAYGSINYGNTKGSRMGAGFIIKQPDNIFNLQWLMGYSLSYMKVDSAFTEYKDLHPYDDHEEYEDFDDQPYSGKSRAMHSAYGQTKWGIVKDTIYLLLGGRLDNYSDFGNQITPRAGLIFLPIKESSIKALYGRAFRAGSAFGIYGNLPYFNKNKDLEPETIDIYELIFMYKTKNLKFIINGFYSKWKNGIVSEFDFDLYAVTNLPMVRTNKGENRSYGGECNVFYSFQPFAVDLGFSYVKSTAFNVARNYTDNMMTKKIIDEEDYVAFPEYITKVGIHYTLNPYDINFFLNNRFYLKMKETHYNRMFSFEEEPEDLPTYWRMDLNISKAIDENAEVTFDIRNLLNRKNYIPSLYGAEDGYEEPGISVLLRAGYKL